MPEPLANAEPTPPAIDNDDESWRRQRPKTIVLPKPVEVIKTPEPPAVEIPNPQLGEFDILVETLFRIKDRNGVIVEEPSHSIIRQALKPSSRGAFMTAVDRAFASAADNVKIAFSSQLKEPILTSEDGSSPKLALAANNDRRTLDPNDIPNVLTPPLPPPQADDFPTQLPDKPIIPKP